MKIQSVRGMHDLFGLESAKYEEIIKNGREIARLYGFETMHTPVIEFCELFERNLGADTDVISKEIYRFQDRSDNVLALRPEFTAGIIRAFTQHSMQTNVLPKKLFSYGQLFRYDRPQAGRYRQFNQLNFEIIGIKNSSLDAECILMALDLLNKCNIEKISLNINFLGNKETCKNYEIALKEYLQNYKNDLSEDSQKRLENSPLRILDSKSEHDIKILEKAPLLSNYYAEEDKKYFSDILEKLNHLNIDYNINDRLVRGLDYYTGIVFEFIDKTTGLTILGGGRYDNLVEQIGGKISLPAIGFAAGIERLMLCSATQDNTKQDKYGVIYYSEKEMDYALKIANLFRKQNNIVEIIYNNANIGKKIAKAEQLNCTKIIICGPDEKINNYVKIKNLITGIEEKITII